MKQKQSYSPEFRGEAVKLVLEQGLSHDTAASRLAIPKGTLANWVAAAKNGEPAAPGGRAVSELEKEIVRLRKELAEARQERDILKKATVGSMSRCKVRVHEGVAAPVSSRGDEPTIRSLA